MADLKQSKIQTMDTGQLALKCAEFFMSLGESCLQFYHKHNKEKQRKTKFIKKAQKIKVKSNRKPNGQADELDEDLKKKLPKKPLTAYIIYFQQKKPNFVQKHPGLNLSELTKLIAKQWKQIDNNQRKPYLAQAQEDRKRYENQMKQFKVKYGTNISAENQEADQQQNGAVEAQQMNQQASLSNPMQNNENQQGNQNKQSDKAEAEVEAEGEGEGEGDQNMDEQKADPQNDNDDEENDDSGDNDGNQGSSGKKSDN